jgi:hypothetical protein
MKFTQTVAAAAVFALVNNVSAVQLKDIFDSYDIETKNEAANKDKEGNVDPAALAKEINGEAIKAEVKSATADVANQAMIQTDSKIRLGFIDDVDSIFVANEDVYLQRDITDKDGDGVEDNVKLSHHELDKFTKPFVYGDVEEMHNTRNGELPGHHLKNDHPEPKGLHASEIPDLRDQAVSSASVVADAKKNAPKEEKKEEKAADAAPAAAEGDKKAAPAEKAEDKPAEEKKVQMSDSIAEIDERSQNDGDSEYETVPTDQAQQEESQEESAAPHEASKEPMPIAKRMAVIDPVIAAQIEEAEEAAAIAESLTERSQSEYDNEYIQTKVASFSN